MSNGAKRDRSKYLYRKTVKGHPYLYFRMADGALVSLPLDESTAEFARSYDTCVKARVGKPTYKAKPVAPDIASHATKHVAFIGGTVGNAITRYFDSAEFVGCKASSKEKYRKAFEVMRDLIGEARLSDIDVDAVDIYSEQIARDRGTSVAHFQVSMIANLWKVCRKYPEFGIKGKPSPTIDAVKRYTVKAPHKPWTDAAQDLFMATAPGYLKLAKLLLHFSAQRGGDCVKMKWTDFDGAGLFVMPEKTSTGADLEPNYHLCPKPLLDALLERQAQGNLADTILTNFYGKPWATSESLSLAIRDHLIKIGLAKRGTKTISMHGLRKNAASEVGGLLLGSAGVKSVTGQKSNAMADYYSKHADQIALNKQVVDRWNEELAKKTGERVTKRRASIRPVK
jgi:integrase